MLTILPNMETHGKVISIEVKERSCLKTTKKIIVHNVLKHAIHVVQFETSSLRHMDHSKNLIDFS